MSFKAEVQKELETFRTWAQDVNMQIHLKTSEVKSNARTALMEAEQTAAILEAKLETLGENADQTVSALLQQFKDKYQKIKAVLEE